MTLPCPGNKFHAHLDRVGRYVVSCLACSWTVKYPEIVGTQRVEADHKAYAEGRAQLLDDAAERLVQGVIERGWPDVSTRPPQSRDSSTASSDIPVHLL